MQQFLVFSCCLLVLVFWSTGCMAGEIDQTDALKLAWESFRKKDPTVRAIEERIKKLLPSWLDLEKIKLQFGNYKVDFRPSRDGAALAFRNDDLDKLFDAKLRLHMEYDVSKERGSVRMEIRF